MNLKRAARLLFPPLVYDAWPRSGRRAPAADPGVTIGRNALVQGHIERFGGQGQLSIGDDAVMKGALFLNSDTAEIRIGNNSGVNSGTVVSAVQSVVIEDDVLISFNCTIMDCDGHSIRLSERRGDLQRHRQGRPSYDKSIARPIRIRQGAWLGAHCMVLKGVTIGVGAIVAAGSVVTKDVPDWTVVAGNPARPVRTLAEADR